MIIHSIDMKKLCLHIALGLAIGTAGCNKFLDKEPDNRAKLNSPEKIAQLVSTAYPRGTYMTFAESISDNVNDHQSGSTPNETMDPYMFRDVRSNQQDSPEFYWNSCYEAIAAANQALKAISEVSVTDQAKYNAVKGEALVARAYSHFMLVTFFSKFYNAATADTDMGIPYVTEPENVVIKQYDRKTVQYVYDMVEKDLLEGYPLLRDDSYNVPKYHFTKIAANAFAARFYLYKKNYQKVLDYTAAVLPADATTVLRPWNSTYLAYTRLELFGVYQKATESANLLLGETVSSWPRNVYSSRYSMDVATAGQLLVRVPALTGAEWAYIYQAYGNDFVYMPKINEYFVKESVNANFGTIYMMAPLFTMEEALFNRAEAMILTGNTGGALALLNQFLSTRIDLYDPATDFLTADKVNAYYGSTTLQVNLRNLLLAYKRAEFVHEGMRWLDIIRYDLPVTHTVVNGSTGKTDIVLPPGDNRRVFQIPQSAALSGVAQNPR
jgi:hypothetical protein